MLEKIVQTTANLLRLAQDTQQNRGEIKEVRVEVRELAEMVQRLVVLVELVPEREARERELFKLQVENLLLRQGELLALPRVVQAIQAAQAAGEA